eukprot:scaffold102724_cov29-Tisochrysis_lutea.AAC.2
MQLSSSTPSAPAPKLMQLRPRLGEDVLLARPLHRLVASCCPMNANSCFVPRGPSPTNTACLAPASRSIGGADNCSLVVPSTILPIGPSLLHHAICNRRLVVIRSAPDAPLRLAASQGPVAHIVAIVG